MGCSIEGQDKPDKIVDKYNKKYHRTNKMNTHIEYGVENNDKDPKFKVGGCVRMSKYKNIFAKGYTPNWSKESCDQKSKKDCTMDIYY